ncbi:phosphatase PAP2 family protein [Streptomyces sp. NPDC058646]|uniref:phosphatase PAP2 family protein n=1 Tax=Streptomyces sp. NPDC058646 TaxID=3346574 RepID=UPI00365958C3
MAGLTTGGPNVDVSLLYEINGIARHAPDWFDRAVTLAGAHGILLTLVLLVLWCWRGARRQDDATAVETFTALVWAPLAAGLALLVNMPLREFVARPRPFRQHPSVQVLDPYLETGPGLAATDFSFVSGHATLAMALGVGLFVANRRAGFIGIGLALLEGFCRVYVGVQYPTDVIGGFALGTAVVLLLAPLAMALLTPPVRALARSPRTALLVRTGKGGLPRPVDLPQAPSPQADQRTHESGLAA